MKARAKIEHQPYNGNSPHVVVVDVGIMGLDPDAMQITFAYQTRERAEAKLPQHLEAWTQALAR